MILFMILFMILLSCNDLFQDCYQISIHLPDSYDQVKALADRVKQHFTAIASGFDEGDRFCWLCLSAGIEMTLLGLYQLWGGTCKRVPHSCGPVLRMQQSHNRQCNHLLHKAAPL